MIVLIFFGGLNFATGFGAGRYVNPPYSSRQFNNLVSLT